jgi:signal transduction histidine kinase
VLVTTVATLGVAAVALLGPLESSLKNADQKTLRTDIGPHKADVVGAFRRLTITTPTGTTLDLTDLSYTVVPRQDGVFGPPVHPVQAEVGKLEGAISARIGGSVYVLGYPDARGQGRIQAPRSGDVVGGNFDDVTSAFLTRSRTGIYSFGSSGGTEYARAALWFEKGGFQWVLAVRKPIPEIAAAVSAVGTAFLFAALAGLGLTLLLAIPLAATLVRRLRELRTAALQLAVGGPVEVPVDRARDEVGDLARTFDIMQRRLQAQEEARRAFVATASHELRTPLTSLDGMLELLDDDLREPQPDLDDARELLQRARAQSRRLGRLAADLLDLSRIDADVKLRSEPVELGELSRAVLAEFELGTSDRGIHSTLDDAAGPVWALGDPGSVAQIIRILLDNAVHVSADGSEIRVELQAGDDVALSVSDQGPGVPAAEREVIFQRFQRGYSTGGQAGFGLGLAIGRELAERMGGELALDQNYTGGAKFTLRLPAAHAPDQDPVPVL